MPSTSHVNRPRAFAGIQGHLKLDNIVIGLNGTKNLARLNFTKERVKLDLENTGYHIRSIMRLLVVQDVRLDI
jgi:hypothetical protein